MIKLKNKSSELKILNSLKLKKWKITKETGIITVSAIKIMFLGE